MVCPFCEGQEDKTPPEILAYRDFGSRPNGPGWRIRVVPNRFPALKIEGSLNKRGDGIYDVMDGIGAHEVIIESPAHHKSMATLGPGQHPRSHLGLSRSARRPEERLPAGARHALQERRRRRRGQPRAHAQPVDRHADRADLGLGRNDRSRSSSTTIAAGASTATWSSKSWPSRSGSSSIRPTSRRSARSPAAFPSRPGSCPRPTPATLKTSPSRAWTISARCFIKSLSKLELALDSPAYNYIIHTAPFDHGELPHYHWHIEVIPRLTKVAGFEWGSGFYINPVPPENAAGFLREVDVAGPDPTPGLFERGLANRKLSAVLS